MTTALMTLSAEARDQLNRVSTATLTSQLQRRGLRSTFLSGLRPVKPGQRMFGYAHTLRYVPLREDLQPQLGGRENAQRRAIESLAADEVLVIEARGETDAGTIGDIYVSRAIALGAAGVVTDGALRDTPAISALDLPVYHRASHAATYGRLHMPLDHQVPIACAGVTVMPGDVIVGDGEGAVVDAGGARRGGRCRRRGAGGRGGVGARTRRGRREHDRRVPDRTRTASRVRGVAGGARPRSARVTRRSVDIDGFRHANPIPGASRVGPLVASSVISGRGGDSAEAQIALIFRHVGDMLDAAGADWRHVVRMNFYVADLAHRELINGPWLEHFPDPDSRPARHTQLSPASSGVTCDFLAYVDE